MSSIDGFWSYVHADDEAEQGRIAQLARDVSQQFELLTGESIKLFLDRDELNWGDDWRLKVDSSLSSIAFFVPVITPRYFKSGECRRELNFFARQAERLGVQELVLPVLWVNFPAFHDEKPSDELMARVHKFQWSDWTELKFAERISGDYRRAVNELANRLVQANEAAEKKAALVNDVEVPETDSDVDVSGTLDKLGDMENSIPQMSDILDKVGKAIEEIGRAMRDATEEIESNPGSNTGFATRLRVARKLAEDLAKPAASVHGLGNDFASSLNNVDEGVRIIIARAPEEIAEDPSSKANFTTFFVAIREMVLQAQIGLSAVSKMIDQISPVEKMSRDLRKPLRILREGLTLFVDGLTVMQGWVALIDDAERKIDGGF